MNGVEGPLAHLKEHPELVEWDLRLLDRVTGKGTRLLDIGAGRGTFVRAARARSLDAIALDMQPEVVTIWPGLSVPGFLGEGTHLPFASGAFNVVRAKEVLEHVVDPLAMTREIRRILKPGGLFLAHVPSPYSQLYPVGNFWDDYTHVRPMSRVALTRLMYDAGLKLDTIEGYTAGRSPIERAVGRVLALVVPHIYRVVAIAP